jgi:ABC-type uncharacterized transport system fused permease/ATPase subunit
MDVKTIENWIIGIIVAIVGIVVVFTLIGSMAPTLMTSAINASNSGLPLANVLFSPTGILLIIFVVVIFLALLLGLFGMLKHKK